MPRVISPPPIPFHSGKLQTVRFNASTDFASRSTNLPPSITSFTMMAWVRQVTLPAFPIFMTFAGNGAATGRYYTALGDADGNANALYSSAAGFGPAGSALSAGVWYHVAITVSGTGAGQFLGYLNGKLDITHTGDNTGIGSAASLWFGSANDNQSMDGYIAAGKVFNRPLTQGEIIREMQQYVPVLGVSEGLNSWMPFAGHSVEQAMRDFSIYNRPFTANSLLIEDLHPPIPWIQYPSRNLFLDVVAAGGGQFRTGLLSVLGAGRGSFTA